MTVLRRFELLRVPADNYESIVSVVVVREYTSVNVLDHDQSSQSLLACDLVIRVNLGVQIPKLYATSLHFPQFLEAQRYFLVAFFDSDWDFAFCEPPSCASSHANVSSNRCALVAVVNHI